VGARARPAAAYTPAVIRQAGPQDVRFLRDMLKHAYHWRLNEDPDLPVARYVNNWGRPGDAGLIAWENGPIGAAWYRVFPASAPGFGFLDETTPELTIAVVPSRRGGGLGRELMQALLEHARSEGHGAISLSAEKDHTGLYEQHGFRAVEEKDGTVTMRVDL
jgi:GNAT superfamily N-acetyltransferase